MPRPAVIQFTSPGVIACSLPIEVAVHDRAVIDVGDRREADMGMRADVELLAEQDLRRSGLVEEDEWADHLAIGRRQRPADGEAAEIRGCGMMMVSIRSARRASPKAGSGKGRGRMRKCRS